jgi:methylmalonyl-CoA mutase N-terminal domain/subunit
MTTSASNSGIPLRPSYSEIEGNSAVATSEKPGEFPFTRGIYPEMYRKHPWMSRQYSGFGLPSETNERAHFITKLGQQHLGNLSVVNAIGDIPSQVGLDSDDPRSRYDVGKCGVAIDTIDDMAEVLKGFDLTRTSVIFPFCGNGHGPVAMLLAVAAEQGVPEEKVIGAALNNAFDNALTIKHHYFKLGGHMRLCLDLIEYTARHVPKFSPIVFGESTHREMGAPADKSAAYALATGIAYTEAMLARGLDIDTFAPTFTFYMNTGNDFFEEIAKYRATRRIWARVMREQFGAKTEAACKARITVRTTGLDLTPQEPLNNVIRNTLQALASVLGGVQSLTVTPFDEPVAIPTEDAQQLAMRVHEILAYETNVRQVSDPLGGSFFMESLTNAMEERIRAGIKEIEDLLPAERARPGLRMFDALTYGIESGIMTKQLDAWGAARQSAIERGDKKIVGINYSVKESWEPAPVWRVDPRVREVKSQMLKEFRAKRDPAKVEKSLQRLREAAQRDENLMPFLRDAYLARATMGETSAVLIDVFGAYVPHE